MIGAMRGLVCVVDASVVVAWFAQQEESDSADRLLAGPVDLAAPDLVLAEAANAMRRKERMKVVDAATVRASIETAAKSFALLIPTAELISEAVRLSQDINHNVYDCIYVVAARRTGAPLVTIDTKLVTRTAKTPDASRVVHLKDWSPP